MIVLYGALFIACSVVVAIRSQGRISKFALDPLGLFLSVAAIVHFALPAMQLALGFNRYAAGPYGDLSHGISLVWVGLYMFAVAFGYAGLNFAGLAGKQNLGACRLPLTLTLSDARSLRRGVMVGLLLPGAIASFLMVRNVLSIGIVEFMSDRIRASDEIGYSVQFSRLLYAGAIAWAAVYLYERRSISVGAKTSCAVPFIGVVVVFSLTGNRNSVFIALLCLALVVIMARPDLRVSRIKIGAVTLVAGVSFVLAGQARSGVLDSTSDSNAIEGLGAVEVVRGLNGAFGNHENLLVLAQSTDIEQLNGTSLWAGLVSVVPRSLWAGKPIGAGPVMKNITAPGAYVLGGAGSSSVTTGVVTEAVLNFGVVGLGLLGIAHGWALYGVARLVRRPWGPLGATATAIVYLSVSVFSVYQELFGLSARTIITVGPVLGLAWIRRIGLGREARRTSGNRDPMVVT